MLCDGVVEGENGCGHQEQFELCVECVVSGDFWFCNKKVNSFRMDMLKAFSGQKDKRVTVKIVFPEQPSPFPVTLGLCRADFFRSIQLLETLLFSSRSIIRSPNQ